MQTVDVAAKYVGFHERTGKNDGLPAEFNAEGVPWCAALLIGSNAQSSDARLAAKSGERWTLRSVGSLQAEMFTRSWAFDVGAVILPERNDLVFFADRGTSDAGRGLHVGIIERVEGTRIHTIEGNVSNACLRLTHAVGDARITGFARIGGFKR